MPTTSHLRFVSRRQVSGSGVVAPGREDHAGPRAAIRPAVGDTAFGCHGISRISSVLHIVPTLFDGRGEIRGGAERYAFELARHMAEQIPTSLISFGQKRRDETIGSLRLRVISNAWHVRGQQFNPFSLTVVPELQKAGVVHCHQQHVLISSVTAMASRLMGRRVFVTDLGGGGWDVSAYISTDRWFNAHLHISQYSRNVYGHSDKSWAHVIYGGVDTTKFSPDASTEPKETILYVGRLLPHKGIDDLIKAAAPDMPVEIIGAPLDERYLRDLKALAEGKRVVFRQDCDDRALVDAYRRAMCVVLPSVYRTMYGDSSRVPELLGQTLMEGMACGIPAICTDVASMPEVVKNGVTGFVTPPNDPSFLRAKFEWLRGHPRECAAMGIAARQWVMQRFSWPAVVRNCFEVYAAA